MDCAQESQSRGALYCNAAQTQGAIFVPFGDLHNYVDIVRNEKPVYARLDQTSGMTLSTGLEPPGEEEGTPESTDLEAYRQRRRLPRRAPAWSSLLVWREEAECIFPYRTSAAALHHVEQPVEHQRPGLPHRDQAVDEALMGPDRVAADGETRTVSFSAVRQRVGNE